MHTHVHTHTHAVFIFLRPHSLPFFFLADDSKKPRILYITAKANETLKELTKVFYDRDGNPDITNEMVTLMRESKGFSGVKKDSLLRPGTRVRMPAPPVETQQHLWCNGRSHFHPFASLFKHIHILFAPLSLQLKHMPVLFDGESV